MEQAQHTDMVYANVPVPGKDSQMTGELGSTCVELLVGCVCPSAAGEG
eukprot:CAMPEP_0185175054 /NCGR_PEP_ID=MMETSP1139-20130426/26169_1 /TAXON_ID=298111 /ORGANISM="Pavlova sp., Strain CCMP459" /LENGTH=47 /DNA_ID= /DNA_START= /DNA_END= /DNA_ORIENTATION=